MGLLDVGRHAHVDAHAGWIPFERGRTDDTPEQVPLGAVRGRRVGERSMVSRHVEKDLVHVGGVSLGTGPKRNARTATAAANTMRAWPRSFSILNVCKVLSMT